MAVDVPRFIEWSYEYWSLYLKETIEDETREAVLTTLIKQGTDDDSEDTDGTDDVAEDTDLKIKAFSTTELADEVESTLEDRDELQSNHGGTYTRNDLGRVLPEFERIGVCYRLPKFENDNQFYIFPKSPLISWFEGLMEESGEHNQLPPVLMPGMEPDERRTQLMGHYLIQNIDSAEIRGGSKLPIKSRLYAKTAHKIITEWGLEAMPEPEDVEITLGLGSINKICNEVTEDWLRQVENNLSLGTSVPFPDEDDPWGHKDELNELALFGEVTLDESVPVPEEPITKIMQQMVCSWMLVSQKLYAKKRGEVDSTEESTENQGAEQELNSVSALAMEPIDRPLRRFGPPDVSVNQSASGESTQIRFGAYHRTEEDDPRMGT